VWAGSARGAAFTDPLPTPGNHAVAIAQEELSVANEPVNELGWIRIRLALAVRDADAGRLDGVVGHYRELCGALDVGSDVPVETGLRMMAKELDRSGERDLAKQASGLADRFHGALTGSGKWDKPACVDSALEMTPAPA